MVSYPTTLPCPLLKSGSSQESKSFIRTQFDYGVRQTRVPMGYISQGFSIVINHYDIDTWQSFWASIDYGTDAFNYSFMVHGDDSVNKVVRFTQPYSLSALGLNKYEVSCAIEVLGNGTPKADVCPKVPYSTLYPVDTLLPC